MKSKNSSCSTTSKMGGKAPNSGTKYMSPSEYNAASKGGKCLGGK